MDSIQDEHTAAHEHEDNKLYMRDDYLRGSMPLTVAASQGEFAPYSSSRTNSRPISPQPRQQQQNDQYSLPPIGGDTNRGLSAGGGHGAATAPAAGGGGVGGVDGKQFFRQARSSLSYEAFNDFLANIKRLNNQQQTRDETLAEARRIFGPELDSLYKEFEQ